VTRYDSGLLAHKLETACPLPNTLLAPACLARWAFQVPFPMGKANPRRRRNRYRAPRAERSGWRSHARYDANDNRLTANESGTLSTWAYDFANRMVTMTAGTAATTYSYETRGNLTGVSEPAGLTTMAYDFENRLKQHQNGSVTATYLYSGDDLKRSENVSGAMTTLV
jgi:YD repeat-containing protein